MYHFFSTNKQNTDNQETKTITRNQNTLCLLINIIKQKDIYMTIKDGIHLLYKELKPFVCVSFFIGQGFTEFRTQNIDCYMHRFRIIHNFTSGI